MNQKSYVSRSAGTARRRARASLAVLAAATLGLSACSDNSTPDNSAATPEAGQELTTTQAPEPPEAPGDPDTDPATDGKAPNPVPPDEGEPAPGLASAGYEPESYHPAEPAGLFIEDVRTGSHGDFDRVVFEFSGTGEPGWDADYPEALTQLASGRLVDHAGDAALNLIIHGVPVPADRIDEAPAPGPVGQPTGAIEEVVHAGIFEADAQYVIGLDHERPFTISVLENPTRLVVDFTE